MVMVKAKLKGEDWIKCLPFPSEEMAMEEVNVYVKDIDCHSVPTKSSCPLTKTRQSLQPEPQSSIWDDGPQDHLP